METEERIGYILGKKLIVYTEPEKFMKYDPPCKECLVQPACILLFSHYYQPTDTSSKYLHINICEELIHFITHSRFFLKF